MFKIQRAVPTVLASAVAGLSMALAVGGLSVASSGDGGSRHGRALIDASLAPSLPSDPAFHGIQPGAAPWVVKRGEVEVRDRRLDLRVRGLVIPSPPGDGTPGQVVTVRASLFCGPDGNAVPADTSKAVPISRRGDARISDRSFAVPDTCLAPVILVHPNDNTTRYIAVDGRRR
jgi:hypothetical protein